MGEEKTQTEREVAEEAMYMPKHRQIGVHGMPFWRKAEDVYAWREPLGFQHAELLENLQSTTAVSWRPRRTDGDVESNAIRQGNTHGWNGQDPS